MLTVPWPSHFTPSMIRMRQRERRTLDLPEVSVRELEEDQAVLELEEGVEVDLEVDQEAVQELAHPPEQGQDQEEVRRAIHPTREGAEQEVAVVPLEEEVVETLKAVTAALLEADQDQEGASLSILLVRVDQVDHLAEEAPGGRDKEEVEETL